MGIDTDKFQFIELKLQKQQPENYCTSLGMGGIISSINKNL